VLECDVIKSSYMVWYKACVQLCVCVFIYIYTLKTRVSCCDYCVVSALQSLCSSCLEKQVLFMYLEIHEMHVFILLYFILGEQLPKPSNCWIITTSLGNFVAQCLYTNMRMQCFKNNNNNNIYILAQYSQKEKFKIIN
jgi:hypothetical protein